MVSNQEDQRKKRREGRKEGRKDQRLFLSKERKN
jgi:hypothetical protein